MMIQRLERGGPGWPERLEHLHAPPRQLFIRGKLPSFQGACIGVVGTRKMTAYGRQAVGLLVPMLVRCGAAVVSGLALGVDGAAHAETLERGGTTVAVLAGGVDDASIYPRAHAGLARRIETDGAVLSEHPPGTELWKYRFPERNRIIAALSDAILVVEAPRRSGALITAYQALELGREVWAVPGPITHANSEGPNRLIKNGAVPILSPEDVARGLGIEPAEQDLGLTADESTVAKALRDGPLSADAIARRTGGTPSKVNVVLTALEMKGAAFPLGDGRFGLYTP